MKIFPRHINIQDGKSSYSIYIKNSASDDRVLMYKIRRSEDKMVEFSPKTGYVEAGNTCTISLKLVNPAILKARLLIKLVVMKKNLIEDDFDYNWNVASKRNGEVKKIIDIVNPAIGEMKDLNGNSSILKQRKANKQLMMNQPSINRIRSMDSEAPSDTSSLSMQQSIMSTGFYSPSISTHSSPVASSSLKKSFNETHSYDIDTMAGSIIDFDNYSIANTAVNIDESAEFQSQSQVLSPTHEANAIYTVKKDNDSSPDSGDHQSSQCIPPGAGVPSSTPTGIVPTDEKNLLEMVKKLSQTPNTATLLVQLLSAVATTTSNETGMINTKARSDPALGSLPTQQTNHTPTASYNKSLLSHAEQTRRFITAEGEVYPSVRGDLASERNPGNDREGDRDPGNDRDGEDDERRLEEMLQYNSKVTTLNKRNTRSSSSTSIYIQDERVGEGEGTESIEDISERLRSPMGETVLLEVYGKVVSNESLLRIVEGQLKEATRCKQKIVALEVTDSTVSSIRESIGELYYNHTNKNNNGNSNNSGNKSNTTTILNHEEDLQKQLDIMRAAYFDENLKHLTINAAMLTLLDSSICRFCQLTSLNLSGNHIRTIEAPLQLPRLRSLDLSNNYLISLDYLQLLVGLNTLIVSNNRISCLSLSVNMLVSLSKSLVTLDMTGNPVCEHHHYAQEVVHVLPRLRFFDSFDLEGMGKSYSYHFRSTGSSSSSTVSSPSNRRGSKTKTAGNRSSSSSSGKRLPDLPQEVRLGRSNSTTRNSYTDKRRDFERRLCVALSLRQKVMTSPAAHSPSPVHINKKHQNIRKNISTNNNRNTSMLSINRLEESDDELEMRSVEDSLQQLNHSIRTTSGPSRYNNTIHSDMNSSYNSQELKQHPVYSMYSKKGKKKDSTVENTDKYSPVEEDHPSEKQVQLEVEVPEIIEEWAEHYTSAEMSGFPQRYVPKIEEESTLLEPTESIRMRRKFLGVATRNERFPDHPQNTSHSRMYSSLTMGDGRTSSMNKEGATVGSFTGRGAGGSTSNSMHGTPQRRRSLPHNSTADRGYFSESEIRVHPRDTSHYVDSARKAATVTAQSEEEFLEMQEEERYGKWHPRYRVPKPIFGFSQPFIHRRAPNLKEHAPLFNTTVVRMRESFRKLPARGTFPRASKGLPGAWYPMDTTEVEAVRRQGYFHDTIGDVIKDTYRDTADNNRSISRAGGEVSGYRSDDGASSFRGRSRSTQSARFLQEALVSPRGSVALSPHASNARRKSWGPHMSRYDRASTVVHTQDDFSQFRKWHQGLFDAAVHEKEGGSDSSSAVVDHPAAAFGLNTSAFSLSSSIPAGGYSIGREQLAVPPPQVSPRRPSSPPKLDPSAISAMDACFEDDIETHIANAASVVAKPLRPPSPAMQLRSISMSPGSGASEKSASQTLAPAPSSLPPTPPRHTPSPTVSETGPIPTNTDKRGTALYLRSTSLDRGMGRQQHTVSLLPLDGRDSADFFLPRTNSYTLSQHPHDVPLSTSYEEDRKVYDALPDYPDSIPSFESLPRPTVGSEKSVYNGEEALSSLEQLSAAVVDPIATEEEEDMANYLSWLNSQQPTMQPQSQQQLSGVVPPPSTATITSSSSSNTLPLQRQETEKQQQPPQQQTTPVRRKSDTVNTNRSAFNSSNIPRYSSNRPSSILTTDTSTTTGTAVHLEGGGGGEEEVGIISKVFSPRDAAMRAEQPESLSESAKKTKLGKSAFQSRTHFS